MPKLVEKLKHIWPFKILSLETAIDCLLIFVIIYYYYLIINIDKTFTLYWKGTLNLRCFTVLFFISNILLLIGWIWHILEVKSKFAYLTAKSYLEIFHIAHAFWGYLFLELECLDLVSLWLFYYFF